MATANFYVIYIKRKSDVELEEVEKKMNLANDWFRVEENLWVVYSTSAPAKWHTRLSPLAKDEGRFFICKLDTTERQGWMGKSFWKWLRREE